MSNKRQADAALPVHVAQMGALILVSKGILSFDEALSMTDVPPKTVGAFEAAVQTIRARR